ncbi:MAG: hypothetical protein IJ859_01670 [Synergistaceae bacterium]|nr:hypothetical protein [Synergistaceae bacterium]
MSSNLAFGFMIVSFCFCFFCVGFTTGVTYVRKKISLEEQEHMIEEKVTEYVEKIVKEKLAERLQP